MALPDKKGVEYRKRREANNLASRRSRLSKKQYYEMLEQENNELKEKVKTLEAELTRQEEKYERMNVSLESMNIQMQYLAKQLYTFDYIYSFQT